MTQVKFNNYNFVICCHLHLFKDVVIPSDKTKRSAVLKYHYYMEDFLITLQVSFIDTQTGEIFFNSQFSKPLSVFDKDASNYCKYFDCFFRGVRQRKHVSMNLSIVNDRDIPQVVESKLCF